MEKTLSYILSLIMVLTMCTSFAFADEEAENYPPGTTVDETESIKIYSEDEIINANDDSDEDVIESIDPENSNPSPEGSGSGLTNFEKNSNQNGFKDVASDSWYADSVDQVCAYGLMKGMSIDTFDPIGKLTIAQCATMSARVRSIYETGSESFEQGEPWYQVYVDYVLQHKIITNAYDNYDVNITRGDFAIMMANTLPDELVEINEIADGYIPDIKKEDASYDSMYALYRAGILNGTDEKGSAEPDKNLTRSEAAAILIRLVNPDNRKNQSVDSNELSAASVSHVVVYGTHTKVLLSGVNSGKALDVNDGKATSKNGTNIQIWDRNNTVAQTFAISHQGGGWYIIKHLESGKVLDVEGAKRGNGVNVILWNYNGGDNQLWEFYKAGNGWYYIRSKLGYYLDVNGCRSANGTNVQTWVGNGTAAQKWGLVDDNYTVAANNFINDSRWKNGISWGTRRPKLSNYGSSGCCAYAADFAKYIYGSNSPRGGNKYNSASDIKSGDILFLSPTHWMCVVSRQGNTLKIAEGNVSSRVRISEYALKGSKIGSKTFQYGYHFL